MNGDGRLDIVGSYYKFSINAAEVFCYENMPGGTFTYHALGTTSQVKTGVVGRFTQTNAYDIVIAPVNSTQGYIRLKNNGNFSFTTSYYAVGVNGNTFMQSLVADFNGDGLDDFFEVQNTTLGVRLSSSNFNLTRQSLSIESYGAPKRWEDINGDGLKDLLLWARTRPAVFYQNSAGAYASFYRGADAMGDNLSIGDADNNGTMDIITSSSNYLSYFTQSTNGELLTPYEFILPTTPFTNIKLFGLPFYDLDNDQFNEIVVSCGGSIYKLDAQGNTLVPTSIDNASSPGSFVGSGDIDNDGNPDVVFNTNDYNRYEKNGNNYTRTNFSKNSGQVVLSDLDGDNDLDLVFLEYSFSTGAISLDWGQYNGSTFVFSSLLTLPSSTPFQYTNGKAKLYAKDFDQDGDPDYFLISGDNDVVVLFKNNGNLNFIQSTLFSGSSINNPSDLDFADFDGDGYTDIVVCARDNGSVNLYYGDASYSFSNHQLFTDVSYPEEIQAVDFDQDGDVDIAFSSKIDSRLGVLLNDRIQCVAQSIPFSFNLCSGDSLLFNGSYYHQAGVFVDSLSSLSGCDSLLVLTINAIGTSGPQITSLSICPSDSVFFQGQYFTQPGWYADTLSSIQGCDSVVGIQLTLYPANAYSLARSNTLLSIPSAYSNHSWYLNQLLLAGENNSSLDAASYGNGLYYSSSLDSNGCLAWSDSLSVSNIGLLEGGLVEVKLFPNPAKQILLIDGLPNGVYGAQILNSLGQLVWEGSLERLGNESAVNVDFLESGVYFLEITSTNGSRTSHSFIKE